MDIALAIFNIGAGLGVLAAGGALVYLAWQTTPLIRESRALTADLRRLTGSTERELGPILTRARELTSSVELLSEDVAMKLDHLNDMMAALNRELADAPGAAAAARRVEPRPVESTGSREEVADS